MKHFTFIQLFSLIPLITSKKMAKSLEKLGISKPLFIYPASVPDIPDDIAAGTKRFFRCMSFKDMHWKENNIYLGEIRQGLSVEKPPKTLISAKAIYRKKNVMHVVDTNIPSIYLIEEDR